MASLIPMAIEIGQQDAKNPNISYGGSAEHSLFSSLDPLGNQITKLGGDPLNLYGNKNNPNALIFPSSNPNANGNGVPATLPTLPNVGAPQIYKPNSFGGYASLGAGPYNAMASRMAGPQYRPQLMGGGMAPIPALAPTAGKGASPTLGTMPPWMMVPSQSPFRKVQ